MKKSTAAVSGLIALGGLAIVGAIALGGVSFMATVGSSMEPGFREGDLAVLRTAPDYGVGDVVAYRSHDLDTVVMHRITAADGGRYTFRGDNNSWFDPEQPTRNQLLGKLALRVPGGGVWLNRATSRTAIIVLTFLLLASGGTRAVVRRGSRRRRAAGATSLRTVPPMLRTAAAAVAALTVGAAGLAAVAWTTPVSEIEAADAAPAATMTYSYVATVPASAAYDGTTVTQPQPVFRNVTNRVDVHFSYETEAVVNNATVLVTAELATASGWRSTVPLAEPVTFSGKHHTGDVGLDLASLQARADAAADVIGDHPGAAVDVTVVAQVATADDALFRSELPFSLDQLALRLADGEEAALTMTDSAIAGPSAAPVPLSVLGLPLPVPHVRRASLIALAVALLGAGGLVFVARRVLSAPEDVSIHKRYGPLLLDVEPVALPAGRPVIEVPLMRGLARLAERYGLMVMHWHRGGVHTYVVFEEHTTYRFRTANTMLVTEDPEHDRDDDTASLEGLGEPQVSPHARRS